jgi:hypothetical protein
MSEGRGESDSGLFGRLPRSRPGTRSPRRATGAAAGRRGEEAAEAETPPPPAASGGARRPQPTSRPGHPAAQPSDDAAAEGQAAGLEELAWAGIAITAEAATLGVRLATRAIEAARKATERR